MTTQATLGEFSYDLDPLTPAEREVWQRIEQGDCGVREYARETGRSAGTVGNLLRRARAKVGGSGDDGGD